LLKNFPRILIADFQLEHYQYRLAQDRFSNIL
jgi:hypothetical protein